MTTTTDPTLVRVEDFQEGRKLDEIVIQQNRERAAERIANRIPRRFAAATATEPAVQNWVAELIQRALVSRPISPVITHGPSLRLLGPTGTGKSYQAYGALRAIAVSGVSCSWIYITAADIYASLRPRPNVDSETEFEKHARIPLLVLDDLGAAKRTEWNEEINYRLINYRYEHEKPTLITSNLGPRDLAEVLGERVTSRLVGMSTQAALKGGDRRKAGQ